MTMMIHRVLIMNIIHALAHGDTDEIRPSDMDNKLLYMLAFSPVYPDAAILSLCAAIKVDPPVQSEDIAVSHRVGKTIAGKPRQVLVKFATRNIRERVFRAKKNIKTEREKNESLKNVYINEDLTQHGANLQNEPYHSRHLDNLWQNYD